MQLTSMFHSTSSLKASRQACSPTFDVSISSSFSLAPSCSSLQPQRRASTFVCNGCGKATAAPKSFVRCSCCKAAYYCGKACQKMDWIHDGVATRSQSHRQCCAEFAKDKHEFMTSPNGMMVRTHVFPWADDHRTASDVFPLQDFLERRGLIEQSLMGFWARPDCVSPQHLEGDDPYGWCHGQILLQENLPSIEDGFVQLASHEIPSGSPVSSRLNSWAEYSAKRNVSRSSIAPLLLTDVLTVYHMIGNELELHRRKPKNGKHFVVCILGAASELNYLALFEELAFLLPRGMDVELQFISPAVKHLSNKAFWEYPDSRIMTCGDYVINKTAPNGTRVRVSLERQHGLFHKVKFRSVPDAAIALDADLDSSDDWLRTFVKLIARETPFCVSEQAKYKLRLARDVLIHEWIEEFNDAYRVEHPLVEVPRRMQISLNPFHGIVGRNHGAIVVPHVSNGYILTWNPTILLPEPRRA